MHGTVGRFTLGLAAAVLLASCALARTEAAPPASAKSVSSEDGSERSVPAAPVRPSGKVRSNRGFSNYGYRHTRAYNADPDLERFAAGFSFFGPWGGGAAGGWVAYRGQETPVSAGAPAYVDVAVRPSKAIVYLDGDPVGEARDFSGTWGRLWLAPGDHVLEFVYPGYRTVEVTLHAHGGHYYRIDERLERGREGQGRASED